VVKLEDDNDNYENDYEIVPKNKVDRLTRELDAMRQKKGVNLELLKFSIDELSESLDNLRVSLKAAKENMENDTAVKELNEKLDNLLSQNHKIAEGILALADIITKGNEKKVEQPQFDFNSDFSMPPLSGPMPLEEGPLNPPPNFNRPMRPGFDMPPPPPGMFPSPGPMPGDMNTVKRKSFRR